MSLVVSLFTATYVRDWPKLFPEQPLLCTPCFDGRAVLYPTDDILRDYLSWRQADTHINNQVSVVPDNLQWSAICLLYALGTAWLNNALRAVQYLLLGTCPLRKVATRGAVHPQGRSSLQAASQWLTDAPGAMVALLPLGNQNRLQERALVQGLRH